MTEIKLCFWDYFKFLAFCQRWRIMKWGIHVIFPVLSAIFYVRYVHRTIGSIDAQTIFASSMFVAILMVLWPLQLLYHSYRSLYYNKKEKKIPFNFQVTQDGVCVFTAVASTEMKWANFKQIIETGTFLLFWTDSGAVVIPKKQLPDLSRVKTIIEANFKKKMKLK